MVGSGQKGWLVVNDVWVDDTGQFVYCAGNDETITVWDLVGIHDHQILILILIFKCVFRSTVADDWLRAAREG